MKQQRLTFLLTLLMSMTGITANAHDIEVENADGKTIYYKWINGNTELAVSCRGNSYSDYSNEYSGNITIPESITYNGNTYSVTSIGDDAFNYCKYLTSIEIPNSVASIEKGAFSYCRGLTSIEIPNSVTTIGNEAFYSCRFASIDIPNSVTSIGSGAFQYCINLISLEIPNSVTSIGSSAFYGCSGLTSVTIGNSVTSIGSSAFYGCSGLTSVILNTNTIVFSYENSFESIFGNQVKELVIGNSVTSIASSAFNSCTGLTSIIVESGNTTYDSRDNCNAIIETSTNTLIAGCKNTVIPNSVTSIGDYAFYKCTGLTSIEIPNSVTRIGSDAFEYCSGLTSVTIGNNVTSIDSYAFRECTGLTSIEIPNSVTSIGDHAFYQCRGLTSIDIPNSVTSIGMRCFMNCDGLTSVIFGISIESIGSYAFTGCSNITDVKVKVTNFSSFCNNKSVGSVYSYFKKPVQLIDVEGVDISKYDIPDDVTSIGEKSFYYCTGLTSVTIGNSVTSIGSSAFYGCSGLTSVAIGNSVTSIGEYAFQNCTGLTSVTIGKSVMSIGSSVFSGSTALTSVTINSNAIASKTVTGSSSLSKIFGKQVREYVLGEDVESIGAYACYNCTNLTSIVIPNSVSSIGEYVFYGCTGLTSIVIPNKVTSIGECVFYGCTGLTSVTIGNSVTSIGGGAFYKCENLKEVCCYAEDVPSTAESSFGDYIKNSTLRVPYSSIDDYRAHKVWGQFGSIRRILSEGDIDDGEYADPVSSLEYRYSGYDMTASVISGKNAKANVVIPETITVDDHSFRVTSIGEEAFCYNKDIDTISLCKNISSIGDYAFAYGDIKVFYCYAEDVPRVESSTFVDVTKSILKVPASVLGKYKSDAVWGKFGKIVSIEGRSVTLDLAYPGMLKAFCFDDEGEAITRLILSGKMNSLDLKALQDDLFSELEYLDLRDVTLVADGGTYNSMSGKPQRQFVLADTCYMTGYQNSMYPDIQIYTYYGNNLAGAFFGVGKLKHVVMPSSCKKIGEYAFYDTPDLETVEFSDLVTSIGKAALAGTGIKTLNMPESLKEIGSSAFAGSKIEYLDLNHVKKYGESAFYECVNLKGNADGCVDLSNVDSIPDYAFSYCTSIKTVVLGDLRYLGEEAFYYCTSLETVTLSENFELTSSSYFMGTPWFNSLPSEDGVVYWGSSALAYRGEFASTFRLKDGTKLLAKDFLKSGTNPTNVTKIELPSSLEVVSNNSLPSSNVTSLTVPEKARVFYASCPKVKTLNYNAKNLDKNGLTNLGEIKLVVGPEVEYLPNTGKVVIVEFKEPSNDIPLVIGKKAFSESLIGSISLPERTVEIDDNAFDKCSYLSNIALTNRISRIGEYAFRGCTGIMTIDIPNNVIELGRSSFSSCTYLNSVELHDGLEIIGANVFEGCSNLKTMEIPKTVKSIGSVFNANVLETVTYNATDATGSLGYKYLGELIIGPDVRKLPRYVCRTRYLVSEGGVPGWYFSEAESIIFAERAENKPITIGTCAFEKISKSEFVLPEGTDSIGYGAFLDASISEVTIPSSVVFVGEKAFSNCKALKKVYCYAEEVPQTGNEAFTKTYIKNATLYVPAGCKTKYENANIWKDFGSIVEPGTTDLKEYTTEIFQTEELYDLQGHRLDCPKKGLNIIRMSDGTIKKVVVK